MSLFTTYRTPSAAASWTPAELDSSVLLGWWDVSDSDNRTIDTGEVVNLTDLSGNSNTMSAPVTADRPTLQSADQNSLDTMFFQRAEGNLMKLSDSASLSTAFDGNREIGVWCVFENLETVTSARNFWRMLATSSVWIHALQWTTSGTPDIAEMNALGITTQDTGVTVDGNYHIVGVNVVEVGGGSDEQNMYIDSTTPAQVTGELNAAGAFSAWGIGNNEVDSAPSECKFGEILLTVGDQSGDTATNIITYLNDKWSIF